MIGKTISHYKILEKLGKGGMGEVFLANDLKLDRKVALKFLSKKFTKNQEAQERFKREAKATAALNHPNIVTIHDISEYKNQVYIVMEYIEGQVLKEKIMDTESKLATHPSKMSAGNTEILPKRERGKRWPLQTKEIIDITLQICE